MFSRAEKNRIYNLLRGYDKKLTKIYLEEGPDALKKKLNIESEEAWKLVFEYLIYEKDIIKQCVRKNPDYIHGIFKERGPNFLRHAFQIADERYDDVWEYVMDYIGISRAAIYEYITHKVVELKGDIYNGKIEGIREKLGLQNTKYDRAWEEILNILLESVSTEKFSYSMFEQGMRMFTSLYSKGRKHRSIKKFIELSGGEQ